MRPWIRASQRERGGLLELKKRIAGGPALFSIAAVIWRAACGDQARAASPVPIGPAAHGAVGSVARAAPCRRA